MSEMKTLTINGVTYEIKDPRVDPWANYAPSDFAKAGFGYGGTPTYLGQVSEANLDALLDSFISAIEDDTPHQVTIWIDGMSVSLCTVIRGSMTWACVRGFTFAGTQGEWVKYKYNGTWLPLEWVNPPMNLGVEYRTTERWNGNVVYTMLIDCGATAPTASIDVSDLGIHYIIRYNAKAGNNSLPTGDYIKQEGYFAYAYIDNSYTTITLKADAFSDGHGNGGSHWYVHLWYIK